MTWAVDQRTGSPARKAVLMNLADRADEAWSCFPGQKRIADDTELGERTVRRALDDLTEAGLILRHHRRRKDGSWTSDRYVLAGYVTDPDAVRLLADQIPAATAAAGSNPDAESLLAGAGTSGQSGRRPERPPVTAAADPAATAAGHEPPVTNPHSSLPTGESAPASDESQLALVDAPAKAPKRKTRIPEGWEPNEALTAWTRETAPGLPRRELDAFRAYHEAHGSTFLRWEQAWQTWVFRWLDRQGRRGPGRPAPYRNRQQPQPEIGTAGGPPASDGWDAFMAGGQDR